MKDFGLMMSVESVVEDFCGPHTFDDEENYIPHVEPLVNSIPIPPARHPHSKFQRLMTVSSERNSQ